MAGNQLLKLLFAFIIVLLGFILFLSIAPHLAQSKPAAVKICLGEESFKEVLPEAVVFEPVFDKQGDLLCHAAFSQDKKLLGYVFKVKKSGYSSDIVTLVAMNSDGVILRIKILSQDETVGIGDKIVEVDKKKGLRPWFQEQFCGKKALALTTEVQAITGATMTSKAVIESIQERAREILAKVK